MGFYQRWLPSTFRGQDTHLSDNRYAEKVTYAGDGEDCDDDGDGNGMLWRGSSVMMAGVGAWARGLCASRGWVL